MTQGEICQLLSELSGSATQEKIAELAQEKYPDRTLAAYVGEFLHIMKEKGLVEIVNGYWKITDMDSVPKIEHRIDELDAVISEETLRNDCGITISNLVGSLRLERELDLGALNSDLENTDYHPETYPSMIYRPDIDSSMSVLTPSSGRLAIVGAKNKEELLKGVDDFLGKLAMLGIDVDKNTNDLLVQNIVGDFDIGREIDLSALSIALGLENIEYEPEQFPGIIYRGGGNSTVLLFNSGKCVITGSKSYLELVQARDDIIRILSKHGLETDLEEYNVISSEENGSDSSKE
ncbi:TATA-box binding family protein [Halorhabdus utahensis DSM 12940]|uniref:TATA-box-binding protein n=1 Tax=Halorhabdus utahensis (strain DSM 12940 / JCM 11049 / AX-2) TaxID=519442 RepID=C7NT11_HALUD|nr:TATA-box-binding protein [Halorhabdus utahensis]ACV12086.1 TATA-box binding family protein [Halorhabdus utahensis DSM 12940]